MFSSIPSPPITPLSSSYSPPFILNPPRPLCESCMCMCLRASSGTWGASLRTHPLLCQQPSVDSSSARGGTSWSLPLSMLRFWLIWLCLGLEHVVVQAVVSLCVHSAVTLIKYRFAIGIYYLCSLQFSTLPSPMVPEFQGYDVSFRADHSTVSYSLNTSQLRVSVLISIYCKKKLPQRELK